MILIVGVYVLLYFFFRNSAIGMIDEIKTNFKLFPKHYTLPPRWMRKHFKLKKSEIPKYLFFRLCVSMFFGLLTPVVCVVCLFSQFNACVVGAMVLLPCAFVIPDTVVFIIMSRIFKK